MCRIFISIILLSSLLITNTPVNGQTNSDSSVKLNAGILPVATIAGLNSGMIDKEKLMKAESLTCSEKNYKIISFTLLGFGGELKSKGDTLTQEMKRSFGEMRSGSKLIFSDITANTSEGKTISLSPIILKIK
jgi:hypothetical protein